MERRLNERDLDEILIASEPAFKELRGAHIFVTGGTGFVGSWMVDSFLWANGRLALGARLTLLARNPDRLPPRLLQEAETGSVDFVHGDLTTFETDLRPDVIINAAIVNTTNASSREIADNVVNGTRHVLDFAARCGPIPVLFTSSGAAYGRQPSGVSALSETYDGAPDRLDSALAYHRAKRFAEELHWEASSRSGPRPKIARLFAFVAPRLPLDRHFAIGNFIRDALRGGPIIVSGDGTAIRTYLYGTDMSTWLWHILTRGEPGRAYNVGSETEYSTAGVASTVARVAGLAATSVVVRGAAEPDAQPERYVPSTARARAELGVRQTLTLEESLRRTIAFYSN